MSVTAILTLYRRPYCLEEQVRAIQAQTVTPAEIIIYKNFSDGIAMPSLPADVMKNVTIIESSKNYGVWARFAIALLANTEYVCLFDDDTIPGHRWFENCLSSMSVREGLYGTVGLQFSSNSYMAHVRYGWPNPVTATTEVDIVGHSWFLKRSWLNYLWESPPDYVKYLKHGEDIQLSFALQKHGIPTFVPPHPPGQYELYGSIPDTAWKYGTDVVAISVEPGVYGLFEQYLHDAVSKGFRLLHHNVKQNTPLLPFLNIK